MILTGSAPQNNGGIPITGYQIERNDGSGFNIIANTQATTYQDTSLIPNSEHSYRVSTVNSAGTSLPSPGFIIFTLPSTTTTSQNSNSTNQNPSSTPEQNSNQSLNDILQQRYAMARQLQELTAPNSNPSPNQSPNPSQNAQQTVLLNESIGVNDLTSNVGAQKSVGAQKNSFTPSGTMSIDAGSLLYPVISLVGVVIVVAVLYLRKKRKIPNRVIESRKDASVQTEPTHKPQDIDYAMTILKNRLAKGEITLDEFKILKEELSEP